MIAHTDQLTGRERIALAFSHRQTDRLPVFDVVNNPDIFTAFLGSDNPSSEGLPTTRLSKLLGLDAVMVPVRSYTALIPRKEHWSSSHAFTDRFGVEYTVSDSSWPLGIATGEVALDERLLDTIRRAQVQPQDMEPIADGLKEAHDGTGGEIALFAGIRSAFSFLSIAGGLVGLSMALYEQSALLHELIEASTDYWTQVGLRAIEAGADALYVANDMGMNGSTLISPTHLREFFLPAFARQCRTWKQAGGRVILHSCGNIMAILPDLAAMGTDGFDGLNNLQSHAGMDIAYVKEHYGHLWTLIGNIDATTVMCTPNKTDIDDALATLIGVVGSDGGAILATDHSFHKGIPIENVLYFIQQAKAMGYRMNQDGGK
ncbi:MAG: uroporphyrinogen decarboxylase family protein [Sphaerochaetaceae bacterium]